MQHSTFFKTSLLILALVFSLLALIPHVQARDSIDVENRSVNADFEISASFRTLSLCECATSTQNLQVSNPGSYPITVHLESENGYVRFAQSEVQVDPGRTETVIAYIKAPCDAPDKDTILIKATSSLGKTKAFTQDIEFSNCQNLRAGLAEREVNASVCQPFSTSLTVKNTGSFRETYEIAAADFSDSIVLSEDRVTLDSGQTKDVFIYYNLPCDIYGEHDADFIVRAVKNNRKATLKQTINIPQDYAFSLDLPSQMPVCQEDEKSDAFRFAFTNDNNFTDTYRIKEDLPSFADDDLPLVGRFFPETVTLKPGEDYVKNISLSSLDDVDEGTYPVSFTVTSRNGDVTKTAAGNISVSDCHGGALSFSDTTDKLYACARDDFSKEFTIANTGSQDSDYELLLNAPDFMTLPADKLSLDAGENESEEMGLVIPDNISMEYPITLELYGKGGLLDTAGFTLVVDDREECYGVGLDDTSQDMLYTSDNITFKVTNDGTRHGIYTLDILNASGVLDLSAGELGLGATETKTLNIIVDKDELKNATASDSDLIGTVVEKTLMVTHEQSGLVTYVPVTIEIVDHSIWHKAWSYLASLPACTLIFLSLALIFVISLFILALRLASANRFFAARWQVLLWGLALVIVAFAIVSIIYGFPGQSTFYTQYNLTTDSLNHVLMVEDSSYTFDYDEYFFDPDDNIETYGVRDVNESILSFSINGSNLTITPVEDWYGATDIELFVVDEYNESASSGPVLVEVLPREDHTVVSFFNAGCEYFNVAMLLLVIIVIFFALSLPKRPVSASRKKASGSRRITASRTLSKRRKRSVNKKSSKKTSNASSSKKSSGKNAKKKTSGSTKKSSSKKTVRKSSAKTSKTSSSKKTGAKKSPSTKAAVSGAVGKSSSEPDSENSSAQKESGKQDSAKRTSGERPEQALDDDRNQAS